MLLEYTRYTAAQPCSRQTKKPPEAVPRAVFFWWVMPKFSIADARQARSLSSWATPPKFMRL